MSKQDILLYENDKDVSIGEGGEIVFRGTSP